MVVFFRRIPFLASLSTIEGKEMMIEEKKTFSLLLFFKEKIKSLKLFLGKIKTSKKQNLGSQQTSREKRTDFSEDLWGKIKRKIKRTK